MRKIGYLLLLVMSYCYLTACNSQKHDVQKALEKMQSSAIAIPYERMECWLNDSILEVSPWNKAKLKLVHYVDSATCSTCYLQKIAVKKYLFDMETMTKYDFYNIFIINPDGKAKKELKMKYLEKLIPQTIFVDTANIFLKENPNIPSESMYHTFLLDENNKVILVGNPMLNKPIEDMIISIAEERLGKVISTVNNQQTEEAENP